MLHMEDQPKAIDILFMKCSAVVIKAKISFLLMR
jgi:hypothetical protein